MVARPRARTAGGVAVGVARSGARTILTRQGPSSIAQAVG